MKRLLPLLVVLAGCDPLPRPAEPPPAAVAPPVAPRPPVKPFDPRTWTEAVRSASRPANQTREALAANRWEMKLRVKSFGDTAAVGKFADYSDGSDESNLAAGFGAAVLPKDAAVGDVWRVVGEFDRRRPYRERHAIVGLKAEKYVIWLVETVEVAERVEVKK